MTKPILDQMAGVLKTVSICSDIDCKLREKAEAALTTYQEQKAAWVMVRRDRLDSLCRALCCMDNSKCGDCPDRVACLKVWENCDRLGPESIIAYLTEPDGEEE